MNYSNGFGVVIEHNYADNYFISINKDNNKYKLCVTRNELEHLKREIGKNFEVVDDDKDWNLAEQFRPFPNPFNLKTEDVKKCRDLIIKELKEFYPNKRHAIEVINKRFGDLK